MSRTITMAVALMILWSVPAPAQQNHEPRVEVAAGYSALGNASGGGNVPPGFFFSFEGTYRPWLAVVGEFSGTFVSKPPRFFGDPGAGTGAFMAGPRFLLRPAPGVVAFGQALIGGAESGNSQSGYPALGFLPGAGVDLTIHRHVAIRISSNRRYLVGILAATGATASFGEFRAGVVVY